MRERIVSPKTSDAVEFPFVQDFDRRWHKRPTDDEWTRYPAELQARTLCGQHIPSVHVSSFDPRYMNIWDDRYCRKCLGRRPNDWKPGRR